MNEDPTSWGVIVIAAGVFWWAFKNLPWIKIWKFIKDRIVYDVMKRIELLEEKFEEHNRARSKHLTAKRVENIVKEVIKP